MKFITVEKSFMVGFAPKTINLNGNNNESCGFYLYIANGTLYSQGINYFLNE
jgi:hypothetical protein